MNIGLRIKELREEKNLSQEELAKRINVTKQMISHYETCINVPRPSNIRKIAEEFGMTEVEFYSGKRTSDLATEIFPEEKIKWMEERNNLKDKIESLQAKIIHLTERQLEEMNKAITEIIRLNQEIERLRKTIDK